MYLKNKLPVAERQTQERELTEDEIFEIMRQNDLPLSTKIGNINMAVSALDGSAKDNELIEFIKKILTNIQESYNQIDLSVQTEATGKNILEENKRLIDELSEISNDYDSNKDKQNLISRMKTIIKEIGENSKKYGQLDSYIAYRDKAREIMPQGMSRSNWIKQGKPNREE